MPINVSNLFHIYNKKTDIENVALKGVSIDFEEHFFNALIGKTGSGKSTFAQHLNYLLVPSSGSIRIDEFSIVSDKKSMKKFKPNHLRKKVGYLFQFSENQLFEESVLKDVMFGPVNFGDDKDTAITRAKKALNLVGIDESFYERSPFELSGGEKRRVAIAGILACEPKYLILDEPTAGLDQKSKSELINLLKSLYESGISILLISHDMDLVYNCCNKVILMHDGKVVDYIDTYDFFMKNHNDFSIIKPKIFEFCSKLDIKFSKCKSVDELIEVLKHE